MRVNQHYNLPFLYALQSIFALQHLHHLRCPFSVSSTVFPCSFSSAFYASTYQKLAWEVHKPHHQIANHPSFHWDQDLHNLPPIIHSQKCKDRHQPFLPGDYGILFTEFGITPGPPILHFNYQHYPQYLYQPRFF